MAVSQVNSVVHLCEDTSKQFDLIDLLVAAGYTATLPINITQMYVLNAAGLPDTTVPAALFTKVDADTVKVDATVYPDRNFTFNTLTIVLDAGPNQVIMNIQVIVDPVNDAPTAEDHTITLNSAAGYVIKETDFGFADPHDANPANQANPAGNNFASVVITALPPSGTLLLNGVAVVFGAEIPIAEIRAGHLVYQPNASYGGQTAFGFEVRDDGGTAGCGASDLSLVHHMVFNIPNAMLGDRVWFDTNANGVQDTGESGAAGLTVSLKGAGADGVFGTADDVLLKTTTTNATGNYLFDHLVAGQYQVQFTTGTGNTFTGKDLGGNDATDSDANVTTGFSQVVTLAANEVNLTVDAGLIAPNASLGDRVWFDTNGNGVQDTAEAGAAGVTVRLLNASGQVIATQTTDASGNYLFTGLSAGQYAVQVVSPNGYKFTTANAGTNDATDSDFVWDGTGTSTGTSGFVTLAAGETNRTVDAGIKVCLVSLGDRVWNDANGNGIQDSGESGVAGVTMQLKGAGTDGVFGTTDDTFQTTTTNATGNYLFSNVAWGQYKVAMTMPSGYSLTTANVGTNDGVDSDFQAVTTTAGPELITNGSFENGSTGWTGLGDTIEVVDPTLSWFGVTGATGAKAVELDANIAGSGTGFYQDVTTVAGQTYQLSVDLAARACTSLATNTVEVWWGNTRIATIDPTSTAFTTYKFNVVGTGGLNRLSFREQAGDDDSVGGMIDNVRLSAQASTTYTTGVYTVASCDDNLTIDAGIKCGPTACASIVGTGSIYEGCYGTYKVHLSQAVSYDTTIWVSATNGTAGRSNTYAPDQTIAAGGYCDDGNGTRYYNQYWDATGSYRTTATGPSDQSWDYALYDTNDNIIGSAGGFYVTIKAGSTDSSNFWVDAFQESVYVDRDAFPGRVDGWWKEAAWENFTLNLSNSSNAAVSICQPTTTVCVGDTSCYTVVSPIALDLDGNGIHTTALIDSRGKFDLGTGKAVDSGWLSSGDGFLAVDRNGNGKIDNIAELFGGTKGDGFAKLATYDTNHDGLVNARDADFAKLLVWQDLNGNHQTDAGELRTLAQAGIASLTVAFTDQAVNQLGNVLGETSTATRADGSSMTMTDVYFNVAPENAGTTASAAPQLSQLLDGGNQLLDHAFGAQSGHVKATDPSAGHAMVDGGETLRHLLTSWNAHGAHAAQMAL